MQTMKPILALAAAMVCFAIEPAPPAAPPKPRVKASPKGKPQPPIAVSSDLGGGKGTVTLVFGAPAEHATVSVRGLDGLTVTSVSPTDRTSFAKGERLSLDVTFTPGEGQSHLVVSVDCSLGGRRQGLVRTLALGKPGPAQLKAGGAGLLTTSEGERVKAMTLPD